MVPCSKQPCWFSKTFNMHLLQYADTPPTPIIRSSFSLASSEILFFPREIAKKSSRNLWEKYMICISWIYTYIHIFVCFAIKDPRNLNIQVSNTYFISMHYIYIYICYKSLGHQSPMIS